MEIITLSYNRVDFLELQLNSLNKWVKDFHFTVYDNCPTDEVKNECERLGIDCVPIKIFGGDPSVVVANSLNNMWAGLGASSLQHNKGRLVYIDSDMFLIGPLPEFKNDWAFVPQVRPNDVVYPWTGLMMFNMNTLPSPGSIKWDVGYSLGADVGGLNHYYLKEHKPSVLELEMWTLIDNDKYSFNGGDSSGPESEVSGNLEVMKELTAGFPAPTSVDMFKVKGDEFSKAFVFHYKSASNYPDFYTPDYNEKKTEATKNLLWKLN